MKNLVWGLAAVLVPVVSAKAEFAWPESGEATIPNGVTLSYSCGTVLLVR